MAPQLSKNGQNMVEHCPHISELGVTLRVWSKARQRFTGCFAASSRIPHAVRRMSLEVGSCSRFRASRGPIGGRRGHIIWIRHSPMVDIRHEEKHGTNKNTKNHVLTMFDLFWPVLTMFGHFLTMLGHVLTIFEHFWPWMWAFVWDILFQPSPIAWTYRHGCAYSKLHIYIYTSRRRRYTSTYTHRNEVKNWPEMVELVKHGWKRPTLVKTWPNMVNTWPHMVKQWPNMVSNGRTWGKHGPKWSTWSTWSTWSRHGQTWSRAKIPTYMENDNRPRKSLQGFGFRQKLAKIV